MSVNEEFNVGNLEQVLKKLKADADVRNTRDAVYSSVSEVDADILECFREAFIDFQLAMHHSAYQDGYRTCLKHYADEMWRQL